MSRYTSLIAALVAGIELHSAIEVGFTLPLHMGTLLHFRNLCPEFEPTDYHTCMLVSSLHRVEHVHAAVHVRQSLPSIKALSCRNKPQNSC